MHGMVHGFQNKLLIEQRQKHNESCIISCLGGKLEVHRTFLPYIETVYDKTFAQSHTTNVAVSCGYGTCFAVRTCDGLYHFIFSIDRVGSP